MFLFGIRSIPFGLDTQNGRVSLWNQDLKRRTHYLPSSTRHLVSCLTSTPTFVALSSFEDDFSRETGTVELWPPNSLELATILSVRRSSPRVKCFAVDEKGSLLACGCNDGGIRIFELSMNSHSTDDFRLLSMKTVSQILSLLEKIVFS